MLVENKIRELREKLGLSQSQLARKAAVNQSFLSLVENKKTTPYPKFKRNVARVLRCPIDEVFPNEGGSNE